MSLKSILFLFLFCTPILLFAQPQTPPSIAAQNVDYTFISDKKYAVIHELEGEVFIPATHQIEQTEPINLAAGDVRIILSSRQVRFMGVEALKGFRFQTMSKFEDRVGYIYKLMDQNGNDAKLKVVVNQDKYVTLLYLYAKHTGEHTFFLAQKTDEDIANEREHFTTKDAYFVRSYLNLRNKEVTPYYVVKDLKQGNELERITVGQNIKINFGEYVVNTPQGSFNIKKAETFMARLPEYPAVKSVIEVGVKGKSKIKVIKIFLNFKQQIEFVEVGKTRYFLMP